MAIKIGVCDQALPGVGVFAPRIVHEMGLDGMSLEMGSYFHGYPIRQPRLQKYYLEEQQKYGIEYPNITLSDLDNYAIHSRPGTPDCDIVRYMLKTAVNTAAAMKIPMVMVCFFQKSFVITDEDLEYTAKAMQYVCDLAGEKGLTVGCENVLTAEKTRLLLEMVARDNIGIFYDSQNYQFDSGLDQPALLESIYDLLVPQLHVKDGVGVKSGSLLGTGNSDFYKTMEVLKQHKYQGWIISENYYDREPLRNCGTDYFQVLVRDIKIIKDAITW
jgi:sugar phosphate isomerase/epimerase